jgi:inorganic pyrophosphatase/exopolyphosphatase
MSLLAKRLVEAKVLDKELARFVSVPILLDTSLFKDNLKTIKWVDADLETYNSVIKVAGEDLKPLGLKLHHVKKDVKKNLGLGCYKLLVKDFKIYKMVAPSTDCPSGVFVGCATLPVPLKKTKTSSLGVLDNFGVDEVAKEMLGLMKDRDFHYFMIITSYNDEEGGKHKEVCLFYN